MSDLRTNVVERLESILESIELIESWSEGLCTVEDFMMSFTGVMAFNACVMRLQVIGEHVGKLLTDIGHPLENILKYHGMPFMG